MEKISNAQLFNLFLQTLEHCGVFLLERDSTEIEYFLFEEFDSDSVSFLSEAALSRLLDSGHISPQVYSQCQLLYEKFRKMEEASMYNANSVRSSSEWHTILLLSDKIKSIIYQEMEDKTRGNSPS